LWRRRLLGTTADAQKRDYRYPGRNRP